MRVKRKLSAVPGAVLLPGFAAVLAGALISCQSDTRAPVAPETVSVAPESAVRVVRSAYASCWVGVVNGAGHVRVRKRNLVVPSALAASTRPMIKVGFTEEAHDLRPVRMASCDIPDEPGATDWFESRFNTASVRTTSAGDFVSLRLAPALSSDCDESGCLFEAECPLSAEECPGWESGDEWEGPAPTEPDTTDAVFAAQDDGESASLEPDVAEASLRAAAAPWNNCHGKTDWPYVSGTPGASLYVNVHAYSWCDREAWLTISVQLLRQTCVLWLCLWYPSGNPGFNSQFADYIESTSGGWLCRNGYYKGTAYHTAAGSMGLIAEAHTSVVQYLTCNPT